MERWIFPVFLKLDTGQEGAVTFNTQPLCPLAAKHTGWMDLRDSAHVVEENYLVPLPGIEIQFPGC
jgi:hypothetical protein